MYNPGGLQLTMVCRRSCLKDYKVHNAVNAGSTSLCRTATRGNGEPEGDSEQNFGFVHQALTGRGFTLSSFAVDVSIEARIRRRLLARAFFSHGATVWQLGEGAGVSMCLWSVNEIAER